MITLETFKNHKVIAEFKKTPEQLEKLMRLAGCSKETLRSALDEFAEKDMIFETSDKIYIVE